MGNVKTRLNKLEKTAAAREAPPFRLELDADGGMPRIIWLGPPPPDDTLLNLNDIIRELRRARGEVVDG